MSSQIYGTKHEHLFSYFQIFNDCTNKKFRLGCISNSIRCYGKCKNSSTICFLTNNICNSPGTYLQFSGYILEKHFVRQLNSSSIIRFCHFLVAMSNFPIFANVWWYNVFLYYTYFLKTATTPLHITQSVLPLYKQIFIGPLFLERMYDILDGACYIYS